MCFTYILFLILENAICSYLPIIHQKLTQITCKKPYIGVKYSCIANILGGRKKHEICNR